MNIYSINKTFREANSAEDVLIPKTGHKPLVHTTSEEQWENLNWNVIYEYFEHPIIKKLFSFVFFIILFLIIYSTNQYATLTKSSVQNILRQAFFKKISIILFILFYILATYITICTIRDIQKDVIKIMIEDKEEKKYKTIYNVFLYVPIVLYTIGSILLYTIIPRYLDIENIFTFEKSNIILKDCPSIDNKKNKILWYIHKLSTYSKNILMSFPIYVASSVFPISTIFRKKNQKYIFFALGIMFYFFSYTPGTPFMDMFFTKATQYIIYMVLLGITTIAILFYLIFLMIQK